MPIELRNTIYRHLKIDKPRYHPFEVPSIISAAFGFQPVILRVNQQIHYEAKRVFYGENIWTVVVCYDPNYFRQVPDLKFLRHSSHLPYMRRFKIRFELSALILENYPSIGLDMYCNLVESNATRLCRVLLELPALLSIEISWHDTTTDGGWDRKKKVLEPLGLLKDACISRVGIVTGDTIPLHDFVKCLQGLMTTSNIPDRNQTFAADRVP